MDYPENREEWWQYLNDNWDDILEFMVAIGIDLGSFTWYDGTILSHAVLKELNKLKKAEDSNIYHALQRVWTQASDAKWIHSYAGFDCICNLCSEGQACLDSTLFEDDHENY